MFKIGDEIVCVKPFKGVSILTGASYNIKLPKLNKIYIIDGFSNRGFIYLKGFHDTVFNNRVSYDISKFRKLEDVKLQQELANRAKEQLKETIDVPLKEEELVD